MLTVTRQKSSGFARCRSCNRKLLCVIVAAVSTSLIVYWMPTLSHGLARHRLQRLVTPAETIGNNNIATFFRDVTGWSNATLKSLNYTVRTGSKSDINGTQYKVPNVVHYVWLGTDLQFTFIHYLSFMSVHRYIKPDLILVYGETGPQGFWWNKTRRDVNNIYHVVKDTPPKAPSGDTFKWPAHASDLLRTQAVYLFGGIYLDADVIVLKSFDPLRIYSTTMGRERDDGICNGIIIAEKRAPFVKILLDQYDHYHRATEEWAMKSVERPHTFAKQYPQLIHVEETSLNRPNWRELAQIFDNAYDWSNNFAVHLWIRAEYKRTGRVAKSPDDIDCANSTFAEIARHAYYGSKELVCL